MNKPPSLYCVELHAVVNVGVFAETTEQAVKNAYRDIREFGVINVTTAKAVAIYDDQDRKLKELGP